MTIRPESPHGPYREGRPTVALVVLCQLVHGISFSAMPLLLPLIREDLGISFTDAGLLSAAATFSYALGQIPAGFLSDRYGPRRLIFIGLLGWSAFSLLLGLIHAFWLAVATQLLAGAFRALLFAPGLSLLASWFPPQRRATAMSLYMLGGFAGTIVLSLGGPLLTAAWGWRAAFMLLAGPGIAVAFAYLRHAREKPHGAPAQQIAFSDISRLFGTPVMWLCAGLQFVRFAVVTAWIVWLPSLLVVDRGLTVQQAGLVIAMAAAFTAPSNTLGGYVSDRLRNPPLVIGGALAVLACTAALLTVATALPWLLLVIALNSIFLQFYFGPLFLVPVEVLGPRIAGTATGFGNLFANIGGFLTAWTMGALKDRSGSFTTGFLAIAAVCLAGVVLSIALARMRKRLLAAQAHA
ncbi:MAG: MFS transporter [Burkholderiales bacterium]|nr:MFS transporter [Burkholderiales bacterium]